MSKRVPERCQRAAIDSNGVSSLLIATRRSLCTKMTIEVPHLASRPNYTYFRCQAKLAWRISRRCQAKLAYRIRFDVKPNWPSAANRH